MICTHQKLHDCIIICDWHLVKWFQTLFQDYQVVTVLGHSWSYVRSCSKKLQSKSETKQFQFNWIKSTQEVFHKVQWVLWKRGKYWLAPPGAKYYGKAWSGRRRILNQPQERLNASASSKTRCTLVPSPACTGPAWCPLQLWWERHTALHTLHRVLNTQENHACSSFKHLLQVVHRCTWACRCILEEAEQQLISWKCNVLFICPASLSPKVM